MVFSSVNQMDTVGAGLRRFTELAAIIGSGLSISLGYSASSVKLSFGIRGEVADPERAERYAELMALVFHCMLLWGTNSSIEPDRVRLSGRLVESEGSMASVLTPNSYRAGQGTTVTYVRADMGLPLGVRRYKTAGAHETMMFLELIRQAPTRETVANREALSVAAKLRQMLALDSLSQRQAASSLGMSVATLQRRLAETGHSYREISRNVRADKLRSLLATDSCLDDVAVELGFSERRSLWRACQDWVGMSPADYRRALRTGRARIPSATLES